MEDAEKSGGDGTGVTPELAGAGESGATGVLSREADDLCEWLVALGSAAREADSTPPDLKQGHGIHAWSSRRATIRAYRRVVRDALEGREPGSGLARVSAAGGHPEGASEDTAGISAIAVNPDGDPALADTGEFAAIAPPVVSPARRPKLVKLPPVQPGDEPEAPVRGAVSPGPVAPSEKSAAPAPAEADLPAAGAQRLPAREDPEDLEELPGSILLDRIGAYTHVYHRGMV
ncbi:MAG TPA: hypothetical protein VGM80_01460 [Gaiellaceae bacterium]